MSKSQAARTDERAGGAMGRRSVLQGLLTGVGAGLAGSGFAGPGSAGPGSAGLGLASSHPAAHKHPQTADAQATAPQKGGEPEFLDAYQMKMLESLAERIVPGAGEAGCARFLDSLLAVGEREDAQSFITALGAIDAEARSRFGEPWPDLEEARQVELLEAASSTKPGGPQPVYWTPGTSVANYLASAGMMPSDEPPRVTLRDHFDHIKGRVVDAYYSSSPGLRELGYTGPYFGSFVGCTHAGGHRKS